MHDRNYGYGRNQQTCYREALAAGADVVIMVHPDYQYTPLLITAMASMVAYDVYDVVLGSRIIGGQALRGGMPLYKYISNRFLTAFENLFLGVKLSEYHTGYRAFSSKVLTTLPLLENSPDFVFDNQMLAQCVHFGFRIGEVSCPTKYFEEASSINFRRSVKYGFGVLGTSVQFKMNKWGMMHGCRASATRGEKLELADLASLARWGRPTAPLKPVSRAGCTKFPQLETSTPISRITIRRSFAPSGTMSARAPLALFLMPASTQQRRIARAHFLREPALIALQTMRAHKLRSFLMLLGVILSVSTLILVVALISGMNEYFASRVANLGSNVFLIHKFPIISDSKELLKATRRNRDITWDDYEALRDNLKLPKARWRGSSAHRQSTRMSGRIWKASTCVA